MNHTATLPRAGQGFGLAMRRILTALGLGREARERKATKIQLMRLTDRQLDDIGLTRGMIETVVMQGPAAIRARQPDGAVQAANSDGERRMA